MEIVKTDEGHQEYYFKQLTEEEQRVYREILNGIRNREEQFYLTLAADDSIDRTYHAVLKDHPEIFWVHNRKRFTKQLTRIKIIVCLRLAIHIQKMK